jgi:hypothetical protein
MKLNLSQCSSLYTTVLTGILIISVIGNSSAQYEDSGKRGLYFGKKEYTEIPIPVFTESKDKLPSPVIENNPEYIALYWKAWELAFSHYKRPPVGSPFVSDFIDEAFLPNIYQWDSIFMIMFARYAHSLFPAIQSLDNFYCRQHENGYICREIAEQTGEDIIYDSLIHTINPPLFSWAEVESYKVTGDKSRFEAVLPVLEKYTEWLEINRKKPGTQHGLYWQTGLGSGMDNTPRTGSAWTDMSAQMVMCYNDMAEMYEQIGRKAEGEKHRIKAKEIADKINSMMWNEEDGLYYDLDDAGKQVKCKTVGCFWPMLAGIASKEQAERLIINLKDPESFWRHMPFPSLAANDPHYESDGKYWLGSVWAPTNVMIIKGINKYPEILGSRDFAVTAVEKYLDGMCSVYKKTGTIWENYSAELDMHGVWARADFVGWSGCGPIELLIEDILGFRPEGANNKLTWNINRIDRHGINNLFFGNITASLICEKRDDLKSACLLKVKANHPFELVVTAWPDRKITFMVNEGENTFEVESTQKVME